jgi:lysozyme family protein
VERAFRLIVVAEGGDRYTNSPADPGGPTRFGVSWRAVRQRDHDRDGRLDFDINGDGVVDEKDIRVLTVEQARQLFLEDYWRGVQGDLWPAPIAIALADSAYNQGPRTAVALLQQALKDAGVAALNADGVIGPATQAVAGHLELHPELIRLVLVKFGARRLARYRKDPTAEEHFLGWAGRVLDLQAELLKEA